MDKDRIIRVALERLDRQRLEAVQTTNIVSDAAGIPTCEQMLSSMKMFAAEDYHVFGGIEACVTPWGVAFRRTKDGIPEYSMVEIEDLGSLFAKGESNRCRRSC